jgi:DNA-binding winged helix-turn-helix (wHTH) protein/tetratricopeptide (TPR) repeat protein
MSAVRFGTCELSFERLELRRDGQVVPVEPQVFDVLAYLLVHRDRVVPKAELLDEVWGDRFVSESALTSRIKSARRAVGDTGRDQRIIRTIHGRGYRFVADVADVAEPADLADPAGRPDASIVAATIVPAGTATAPAGPSPARAADVLDALAEGHGVAVRIEGASRADRTDLLHRLADDGRRRGLAVGMSAPSITATDPFACVADALDEMTQRRPALLDEVPERCRIELERVFDGEGPSTRQRWLVAARELLMVAAERTGVVLLVDHVEHAPPEALALIDDVARLTRSHRIGVVIAGRPHTGPDVWAPAAADWFTVLDLGAESPGADGPPGVNGEGGRAAPDLPADMIDALRLVALAGDRFDDVDVRAATGLDDSGAHRLVEAALRSGAVVPDADGYRFAAPGAVDGLVAGLSAPRRAQVLDTIAHRLADLGADPARVAERYVAAGCLPDAAPYALAAARRAAAVQLHREVLRWTDVARAYVRPDDEPELRTLRADALFSVGDPGAVIAYRSALALASPADARGLRARLARAALYAGDVATASEALSGLEPDGGPDDAAVLHAQGMLAYFSGDLDAAGAAGDAIRGLAVTGGAPVKVLDGITLQGLVAHNRGEWFDRLGRELRATSESPALATAVFDSHLCVAEYLLYGPTPYDEVIRLATRLREQAEQLGARPAAAFATAVTGEAALLAGDLDAARRDLTDAIEMHTELGADMGTSHALQRLAELELIVGEPATARRMLRRALLIARWTPLASHLLQRIYGTLVAAAPDTESAIAVVEESIEAADEHTTCIMCHVMIAVPAAIAYAEGGRLDEARAWLAEAEVSAALWQGTAWQAAVREARAHLARAEGDEAAARRLLDEAASLFDVAGQPLDAQRCLDALDALDALAP